MKKKLCCNECGCDNIEWKMWVDEINNVSNAVDESSETWCNDCSKHTKSIFKKDYKQEIIK